MEDEILEEMPVYEEPSRDILIRRVADLFM